MIRALNKLEIEKSRKVLEPYGLKISGGTINGVSVAVSLTTFGKMNGEETVSRDKTMRERLKRDLERVYGLPVLLY